MSTRNFAVAQVRVTGSGVFTVYVVPVGHVLLLKSVFYHLVGDTAASFTSWAATPAGIVASLHPQPTSRDVDSLFSGWIALNAGDSVNVFVSNATSLDVWVSGALLPETAPA